MMGQGAPPDRCVSPPEFFRPPKFDFNNVEEAKAGCAYLEQHGYVVARAVLTQVEVTKGHSLFWDFLEGIPDRMEKKYPGFKEDMGSNVDRNDVMTWINHNWPGSKETGIINDYGANHSPFAWFVRSRERVKQVFECVWQTSDLLVSFDAVNAFRPWEFDSEWKTKGGWFHVDQNPKILSDKVCIQGLVALTDVTEQSGGLCVFPGSHANFLTIQDRVDINWDHHFVSLPKNDPLLTQRNYVILCDAGDMCLWDSRTVHCNSPGVEKKIDPTDLETNTGSPPAPLTQQDEAKVPVIDTKGMTWQDKQKVKRDQELAQKRPAYLAKKAQKEKWDLLRLVAYVCMTPTSFAHHEVIKQRQEAVRQCQGTSHWPQFFIASGREQPDFGGNQYIVKELVVGNNKGSCSLM